MLSSNADLTESNIKPLEIGDYVRTIKGAQFWGRIIALDNDKNLPGATVMAIAPGFRGIKHVYPLKQLEHLKLNVETGLIDTQWMCMAIALQRIAKWFGEFPPTGKFYTDESGREMTDHPMSYGACYGSNGERDYMRQVAQDALDGKSA